MTIITGSASFQELFQGLLAEIVEVGGQSYGVPVIKLTDDSVEIIQLNALIPSTYDYIDLTYTGTNISQAVFKQGGAGGTTIATLLLTYVSDNLKTVTRI